MGYCYAMAGRRDEAQREIGILKARSESTYVSPTSFAAIYAGLGDVNEALVYLERAVEVRDTSLPVHLLSTEFDHLRDHPQFQNLRGRIGLLQATDSLTVAAHNRWYSAWSSVKNHRARQQQTAVTKRFLST